MSQTFRVGLTRDILAPDGTIGFGDIGLSLLDDAAGVEWEILAENRSPLRRDQVQDYDALLVLGPSITTETLEGVDRLTILARFGVGYDTVDVDACTQNGVLLTITPDGVRRPVAAAVITFILALSQKLLIKDRLTRDGRWGEKLDYMGNGCHRTDTRLGRTGQYRARGVQTCPTVWDASSGARPLRNARAGTGCGVELVDLETLLHTSDFVSICCALTPETHHLINAERLALMKETAYLINAARGPIVDQAALTVALQEQRIQGAALDVFEQEPVDPNDPILTLDNVIVTPHGICWTDECFLGNGRSACESILDVAAGRIPSNIVNRDALDNPRFQEKLRRYG